MQTELLKVKNSQMTLYYGQDMFIHLFLLIALSNPLIWTNHSTEIMAFWINIEFAWSFLIFDYPSYFLNTFLS